MESPEGIWILSAVVLLVAVAAIIGVRLLRRGSPQGASGQGPDADPADPASAAFSDKVNVQHPCQPGAAGTRTKQGSDETVAGRHDTATQFEGYPSGAAWADLVVGFDFGTSCTKVVVQSPFIAGSRAVAVPWCGDRGGDSYLLPTELCRSMHGDLHLHPGGDSGDAAGGRFSDIKTSLMDRSADERSRAVAAAYLGLALRRARRWFLDTQADIYGRYSLRWAMNLGMPSAGYDDERVRSTFGLVARAAWELSLYSEAPTIETAARACHSAEARGATDSETPIDVVPEIVAEVVGYARSKRRQSGLHVVVDVGASTLDICGFNLYSPEGEDRYSLLTALVERLGLHALHGQRMEAIPAGVRSRSPALDPSTPMPVRGSDYVVNPSNALRTKLDAVDDRYALECTNALMRVLMDLRQPRSPHAEAWKTGLPLFLAGGGRDFAGVHRATRCAHERLTKYTTTVGILPRALPKPATLVNEDAPDGRLDVAYGLSFDRFDIGEIHRPADIPDVDPPLPGDLPDISKDALQ